MINENNLLEINDLSISIPLSEGLLTPVRGVSLQLKKGETLGLVGESGCGKSLTCKEILRINSKNCKSKGTINYNSPEHGQINLVEVNMNSNLIRKIRGKEISMIYQEPMSAFSPLFTVGYQIREAALLHLTKDKDEAKALVIDMMKKVGIANAERRYSQYPHEFSGGMLQRCLIALALICKPQLLLADEPTTALDVTIRAQILDLLEELQKEYGMSMLYVTHDLGTVAKICDNVAVMYLGKIVEYASCEEIFKNPIHPYTIGLMNSVHKIGNGKGKLVSIEGVVPVAMNLSPICGFASRCPSRSEECLKDPESELFEVSPGHFIACPIKGKRSI